MANSAVAFGALMASILALYWAATYGRKIVARARFIREISELRDEVEDHVFAGRLPDVECVEFFRVKTQVILDNIEIVSLSTFAANESVTHPRKKLSSPTLAGLTPPQRKTMHDLEEQFVHGMARYIVTGSRMWLLLAIVARLPLPKANSHSERRSVDPEQMAEDFNRTLDTSKVRSGGKLGIRPELLAI